MRTVVFMMNNKLTHRGPDDGGLWIDEQAGIALGHRRLSIIDLSEQGPQSTISESGRYAIAITARSISFVPKLCS